MGRTLGQKCPRQATFNFKGSKPTAYCSKHAEEGMVDVRKRRCVHDSCPKVPNFNFEGSKPAAYCRLHAEDGMVDVRSPRCLEDACTTRPTFNFGGSKPAAYCKLHAKDTMVDVNNRRCFRDHCTKVPSFNLQGSKPAVYCKTHAEDGIVDVTRSRCLHDSCKNRPNYSFEGSKPATHCEQHAEHGMVDVRNPRWLYDTCTLRPSCKCESRKEGYCKLHAEDGAINVRVRRSRNIPCTAVEAARPVPPDGVPTVCAGVKIERLERPATSVSIGALCEASGCLKQSKWGIDWNKLTHCLDHALVKDKCVARTAAVEMACSKEYDRSSFPLRLSPHIDHNGDGCEAAAKRSRHRERHVRNGFKHVGGLPTASITSCALLLWKLLAPVFLLSYPFTLSTHPDDNGGGGRTTTKRPRHGPYTADRYRRSGRPYICGTPQNAAFGSVALYVFRRVILERLSLGRGMSGSGVGCGLYVWG